ncbi:MAG: DUF3253 domain-containing protein [Azospirillaceae bacterium]
MSENDEKKPDALVAFILERAAYEPWPAADELARAFAVGRVKPKDGPEAWRKYLNPVKQQVLYLARTGQVQLLRKGEVVEDPDEVRGRVTIRRADLPQTGPAREE